MSLRRNEEAILMMAERSPAGVPAASRDERLERGEILLFERCPFALPEGDDHRFLMEQQHSRWGHKNISWNPHTAQVAGFRRRSAEQTRRLARLLAAFSSTATAWLAGEFPRYGRAWQLDRASLRPEEEATRRLRQNARNDLLHIDAFPTRPAVGRRILRLFVNINPSEPRIWATSEPFARLLARYGRTAGLPGGGGKGEQAKRGSGIAGGFSSPFPLIPFFRFRRSPYDLFMLRFHDFLKANDDFQERSAKRYWSFPPGSAWLACTDGVAHAELRGRHALEHSWFVAPDGLALPDESPAALLARSCDQDAIRDAA